VLVENPVVIHVTAQNYDWLPEVQTAIRRSSKRHIILVAQGEPLSGIMGLVNCIRREPGSELIRLEIPYFNLFIMSEKNISVIFHLCTWKYVIFYI
jgi:hypothetical protein